MCPSRCPTTGKHNGHSDIRDNKEPKGVLKDDEERGQLALAKGQFTLAHLLKSNGYHTRKS